MVPVLNGMPSVFVKNNSNHPPTVIIPGTTPYRTAATRTTERSKAKSEPFKFASGTFL